MTNSARVPYGSARSIKRGIKWLLNLLLVGIDVLGALYGRCVGAFIPSFKPAWRERQRRNLESSVVDVSHRTTRHDVVTLSFHIPNGLCEFRARTFSAKEPDTLARIDEYGDGGVLYDIGANIGLYSVYFAKSKRRPVYAFEPSVFNLPTPAKNINANGVQSMVRIIPKPLSASDGFANSDSDPWTRTARWPPLPLTTDMTAKNCCRCFRIKPAGSRLTLLWSEGSSIKRRRSLSSM